MTIKRAFDIWWYGFTHGWAQWDSIRTCGSSQWNKVYNRGWDVGSFFATIRRVVVP